MPVNAAKGPVLGMNLFSKGPVGGTLTHPICILTHPICILTNPISRYGAGHHSMASWFHLGYYWGSSQCSRLMRPPIAVNLFQEQSTYIFYFLFVDNKKISYLGNVCWFAHYFIVVVCLPLQSAPAWSHIGSKALLFFPRFTQLAMIPGCILFIYIYFFDFFKKHVEVGRST